LDRKLIEKIIGKNNYVSLNDEIYILREITNIMRRNIQNNLVFRDEFINEVNTKTLRSKSIVKEIIEVLENDSFVIGYTNSKSYLLKYLKNINNNLEGIIKSTNPFNYDELIIYANSLIDLILIF
jgi:hypothetical protein